MRIFFHGVPEGFRELYLEDYNPDEEEKLEWDKNYQYLSTYSTISDCHKWYLDQLFINNPGPDGHKMKLAMSPGRIDNLMNKDGYFLSNVQMKTMNGQDNNRPATSLYLLFKLITDS